VKGAGTPFELPGAARAEAAAPRRRAHDVDSLIRTLVDPDTDVAIAAVGGYGRGRLSPHSDVDLLVLERSRTRASNECLRSLLYPLWDAGYRVGHSVRSPKESIAFARRDLNTLTALMSARHIVGRVALCEELLDRRDRLFGSENKRIVRRIIEASEMRRARFPRAGWSLAPNIKEAAGGLRDLSAVEWLQALPGGADVPPSTFDAGELFLAVREVLHDLTGRKTDVLHIELQTPVAARLGLPNQADELMRQILFAARHIEHNASLTFASTTTRVLGGPRRSGTSFSPAPGVVLRDGELSLVGKTSLTNLVAVLRLLASASHSGRRLSLAQLLSVAEQLHSEPLCWSEDAREELFRVLSGRSVVKVLELLDTIGLLTTFIPEWTNIRGRAQLDPHHSYTVDGHSFMTVAEVTNAIASDPLVRHATLEAGDHTSLYLAALLHDIGKGSGEDHSTAGERLARSVCERIGLEPGRIEEVATLVRHHLLLSDTATRRDLDDGSVVEGVAKLVGDARLLRLLYGLSAADGRATGPNAWSDWKATLVTELYRKTLIALETGDLPSTSDVIKRGRELEVLEPRFAGRATAILESLPSSYLTSATASEMADELLLLTQPVDAGEVRIRIEHRPMRGRALVALCARDRPGILTRAAGVLSLHRMSILKAHVYATTTGLALQRFVVHPPRHEKWERVENDLAAVFGGRLAVDAALRQKIADYKQPRELGVDVRILNDASDHSTVVEVRTTDTLGLLYTIAAALTELDVDIHVAKIDTLGGRVVDVFYVRTPAGTKIDEEQARAIECAIRNRIDQTLIRRD
jgi:[protein-PII] uridylyltransferase